MCLSSMWLDLIEIDVPQALLETALPLVADVAVSVVSFFFFFFFFFFFPCAF